MIYQSEHMTLYGVAYIFQGKVNDAVICRDKRSGKGDYYTVLVIKEHETVKKLIRILERSDKEVPCFVDMFYWRSCFCIVFDYIKERKLSEFYIRERDTVRECEKICRNILIQCMLSSLPYPLLYLILKQGQIHLYRDNSIALGCMDDLEGLDEEWDESQCVMQCTLLIRRLLLDKTSGKSILCQLLEKRIPKHGYESFQELLQDVRLSSCAAGTYGFRYRIKEYADRYRGAILRLTLCISVILLILALLLSLSHMIWGEIPALRIFSNHFRQIGTESLVN